jgi:hypothetical protein
MRHGWRLPGVAGAGVGTLLVLLLFAYANASSAAILAEKAQSATLIVSHRVEIGSSVVALTGVWLLVSVFRYCRTPESKYIARS